MPLYLLALTLIPRICCLSSCKQAKLSTEIVAAKRKFDLSYQVCLSSATTYFLALALYYLKNTLLCLGTAISACPHFVPLPWFHDEPMFSAQPIGDITSMQVAR